MRIPAHLRRTQCSIMLHLIDICFLTCICLWQISKIQTCLRVAVGPGLVSTSAAFMRSIASHPVGPHGRLAQKRSSDPHCCGQEGSTQFAQMSYDVTSDRGDQGISRCEAFLERTIAVAVDVSNAFDIVNIHT